MDSLSALYTRRAALGYLEEHGRGAEQAAAVREYPQAVEAVQDAILSWSPLPVVTPVPVPEVTP